MTTATEPVATERQRLPNRRPNWTQKARVGGQVVYFAVGVYEDGRPGEVFIDVAKAGTALRAWANSTAILMSLLLQHGVPLAKLVGALQGINSESFGSVPVSGHARITQASGVLDFVVRVLGLEYLGREELADVPLSPAPTVAVDSRQEGDKGRAE